MLTVLGVVMTKSLKFGSLCAALAILLMVPAWAQNECSNAGLFAVPAGILADSHGVIHQTICWNAATGQLSLPLSSISPSGTAGGVLTGTYPNPGLASNLALPGAPTTTTPATSDNSTKVATTAYVQAQGLSLTATINLTSTQLLAANVTPVTMISAPGSGNMIIVESAQFNLLYGGTAYTGTPVTTLRYVSGTGQTAISGGTQMNTIYEATANEVGILPPAVQSTANVVTSSLANEPIVFFLSSALTLGNGTMNVIIRYHIISVS